MNSTSSTITRSLVALVVVLLAGVLFLATPGEVSAATCGTTGTSSDWMSDTTWSCGGVPGIPTSLDDVVINHNIALNSLIPANALSVTINSGKSILIGDASDATSNELAIVDFLTLNGGNLTFGIGNNISLIIGGSFTNSGTFDAGEGTVYFNGTSTIGGTSTTTFNHIKINSGKQLTGPSGNLIIEGDFTNDGTYLHHNGTVSFNGGTTLSGNTITFNHVTISPNDFLTAPDEMIVLGNFTNSGNFECGNGTVSFNGLTTITGSTTFNNISIGGTLQPATGTVMNLVGNWSQTGTFTHNAGTVSFIGTSGVQTIDGTPTFYNLTLNSNQGLYPSSTIIINNNLNILSGAFYPVAGSTFKNVIISGGSLVPNHGDAINISGNWTRTSGSFSHNLGTVIFNGGSLQHIYNTTTFYNLTIANSGTQLQLDADIS